MTQDTHQKVTSIHLRRNAYLYIRQSTLRQVFENTESTKRQYGLRQKAIALGWPEDRIVVIDNDLGQSGVSEADREGFQRLVTEVSLGRAGIVLGLEVSRLARNNTDWHRLLAAKAPQLVSNASSFSNQIVRLWLGSPANQNEKSDPSAVVNAAQCSAHVGVAAP